MNPIFHGVAKNQTGLRDFHFFKLYRKKYWGVQINIAWLLTWTLDSRNFVTTALERACFYCYFHQNEFCTEHVFSCNFVLLSSEYATFVDPRLHASIPLIRKSRQLSFYLLLQGTQTHNMHLQKVLGSSNSLIFTRITMSKTSS